jgi:hypothetical protein
MDFNTLSTAIDITLHKYNYLDNQIWTKIKNQVDHIELDGDSVLVSVEQLYTLLEANYSRTINKIKSVGAEFLHKEVNSPWFLYAVCNEMSYLQYIKFTLSYDKKYTRMLEIEGEKMVKFDFKVLSMTVGLYDFFTKSELDKVNKVLIKIGLFQPDVPYLRIKLDEFLTKVDDFIAESYEADESIKQESDLLASFMDLIDPKIDRDNPLVLFVTDY